VTLKKDDIRMIYQDPIGRQKPEGKAVLIGRVGLSGVVDGRRVESWWVKFLGWKEEGPALRDIMDDDPVPAIVVSWDHLKPNQIKVLEKLHREHGRTHDCNSCHFYKGQASPYPGTRTPGTFGKCIHREGPCRVFVPRLGIGGRLPEGWSIQVIDRQVQATDPAGEVKVLKHVKELVGEISFGQGGA
jgi:hypothetical protein